MLALRFPWLVFFRTHNFSILYLTMGTQDSIASRPLSPESLSSLYRTSNTIDDLTLALSSFSPDTSQESQTNLNCCCATETCENLQSWYECKVRLESKLTLSAGECLISRVGSVNDSSWTFQRLDKLYFKGTRHTFDDTRWVTSTVNSRHVYSTSAGQVPDQTNPGPTSTKHLRWWRWRRNQGIPTGAVRYPIRRPAERETSFRKGL